MATSAALQMEIRPAARLFRALGDEMRLRIVALLSHGELCVCHLQRALELTQPTVSRHMAVLRNAGVVDSRREGSWVHYRLAPQADRLCKAQLRRIALAFGKQRTLRQDVARLVRGRGATVCS